VAIGVVAVERLFGFVGLIVAVPIIVTFKILLEELWISRIAPTPPRGAEFPAEEIEEEIEPRVEA
jgi:predicted PurR-regulated permease PerM